MCLRGSHILSSSLSHSAPWKRTGTEREENTQGNCSAPTGVHCRISADFGVSSEWDCSGFLAV